MTCTVGCQKFVYNIRIVLFWTVLYIICKSELHLRIMISIIYLLNINQNIIQLTMEVNYHHLNTKLSKLPVHVFYYQGAQRKTRYFAGQITQPAHVLLHAGPQGSSSALNRPIIFGSEFSLPLFFRYIYTCTLSSFSLITWQVEMTYLSGKSFLKRTGL